jgi:hypothetical protein
MARFTFDISMTCFLAFLKGKVNKNVLPRVDINGQVAAP